MNRQNHNLTTMKKIRKHLLLGLIGAIVFASCEENEPDVPQAATVRVVNAILDVGEIDLKDFQGNFSLSGLDQINYAFSQRYTVPARTDIALDVAPTSDTLDILFSDVLRFDEAGSIITIVLFGDSTRVESFTIEESFSNYSESIYGIRFINLSEDSEAVRPRAISLDTTGIRDTMVYDAISFREATAFNQVESGERIENWTFQYVDDENNVLYSTTVPLFFFFTPPTFRNITIPLVGRFDDGEGGSDLTGFTIEHF